MIASLRQQLYRDEGVRLKPYQDSEGLLTIGVGRCLDRVGISMGESELMLDNDIARTTAAVLAQIPWSLELDEIRRAVLINMAFNVGIAGLLKFERMLAALKARDYARTATEMLASKWRKQTGVRAERLAQQMVTGEWV
jgi:lysozyme